MGTERTDDSPESYSDWLGKPVVLVVAIRDYKIPMPCTIVGESGIELRVRIRPGWEMEIRKELIYAVEADPSGGQGRVN
jgi:hypothetical protein